MLDTEAALARALERAGLAPAGAGAAVTAAARASAIDAAELGRQAALTGNPVPALVRALAALRARGRGGGRPQGRDQPGHHRHGRHAARPAARSLRSRRIWRRPRSHGGARRRHRDTVMSGRTLLQQAVPVTFGLVAAGWLTGLDEARAGLDRVRAGRLAVQFGGAAGTLASLGADGPRVAALLAEELGLPLPVLPWHTDRLRIIELAASWPALRGAGQDRQGRDPARPDRGRPRCARETTGRGTRRGGSSAMPHKRNPVAAIAILGCTRQVPGLLATLAAAAEQEHQRAAGAWHSRMGAPLRPAPAHRSAASWSADPRRPDRRPGPDARQPRRGGRPPAGRARDRAAGPGARQPWPPTTWSRRPAPRAAAAGTAAAPSPARRPRPAGPAGRRGHHPAQVESALDPAGYLGATAEFDPAAPLAAHAALWRPGACESSRAAGAQTSGRTAAAVAPAVQPRLRRAADDPPPAPEGQHGRRQPRSAGDGGPPRGAR